jgi:hypothetical protein
MNRRTLLHGLASLGVLPRPDAPPNQGPDSRGWFNVRGYGALGDSVADDTNPIQRAMDACATQGGGVVYFPRGIYRHDHPLVAKHRVNWVGDGIDAAIIRYFGTEGPAVDGRGTDAERKIFALSDLTLLGDNAGASVGALELGHNHRSLPLLARVKLDRFPGYGIRFSGDEWILSFEDVQIADCATSGGTSAVVKAPEVTSFNAVTFSRVVIEGSGSPASAAGAIHLPQHLLGVVFRDCTVEGNAGVRQILITGADNVVFDGLYSETDPPHARICLELSGCTGAIRQSRLQTSEGAGSVAIRISDGSSVTIDGVMLDRDWSRAGIEVRNSTVSLGLNRDERLLRGSGSTVRRP